MKHYHIIHGKLNFTVPCPPPYRRKVWEYNSANIGQICSELSRMDINTSQKYILLSHTFLNNYNLCS